MSEFQTTKDILLDESFSKTPDMGDYLDNDDINALAKSIADGSDGGAYFLEAPFSTELGYHEAENVFVISSKRLSGAADADTVYLDYPDIQDGNKPFVFLGDGKKYDNVKEYIYNIYDLNSSIDSLQVRLLGINAPEVPHCRTTYVNENSEIYYAKFNDLVNNSNVSIYKNENLTSEVDVVDKKDLSFIYFDYNTSFGAKNEINIEYVGPRKADATVKFLKVSAADKEVYYEIVSDTAPKIENDSSNLPRKGICFLSDPSDGHQLDQDYHRVGLIAKDELVKQANNASEMIFVLDGSTFKQQKDDIPLEYRGDAIRMSDDPTFAFQYFYDQIVGKEKSYTRLGYRYFGQDFNKRALGALYLKINYTDPNGKNYGDVWINAAKYLSFIYNRVCEANKSGAKEFEILPGYTSSPSNESAFNYNSGAFKMWSYDPSAQVYIDSFNDFHSKMGGDDRAEIQKALTGSDLDQLKEYTVLIGDTLLMVPPTSIRMVSQTTSQRTSLIRAKGAITKSIPKNERIIEMQLYFNGDAGINGIPYEQKTPTGKTMTYYMNGLRSLLAQFKFTPYLPIDNKYINQVLNVEAVSLSSISINTVPGFPKTLQATIRLIDFEYRQFMPEILPPNIDNKEDLTKNLFAQTIHFPVMRYYYQRAIQNGEVVIDLDYNTQPYLEATLGQKTVLQPMKFKTPLIDFYMANEEHLKLKKQLKEALEKKPFETVVTYTDTEKNFLKEVAKMNSALINTLSQSKTTAYDINKLGHVYYAPKNEGEIIDIPFSDCDTDAYGVMGKADDNSKMLSPKEVYSEYMIPLENSLKKFWGDNNTFDHSIIKNYNIVSREYKAADGEFQVLWGIKIVIDWSKGSSNLLQKVRQDYGKSFAISTDLMFVDESVTVGFMADFVLGTPDKGVSKMEMNAPFATVVANGGRTPITYMTVDTEVMHKLANDFTMVDLTTPIEGDDLFSQNQELAKMKDNIDLETSESMKFDPYPLYNCTVQNVSVVYNNNFTKMSLSAMHGYVSQYIGASDTAIEINLQTRDEATVTALQALPRMCVDRLINYRKVMTCSPLRIDCEVARLAGINEVIIESIDINTVPNFPGLYTISIRLTSVDRTLRNREALKKIDVDTSRTNNDNQIMAKTFFDLKGVLAKVELYPDLELPTLDELAKLGYYFIRYKNQKGRIFPDADFYFVYLHAYTSEMLRESIVEFFNAPENMTLMHQITGDLVGDSKDISINLTGKNSSDDKELISNLSESTQQDALVDKMYEEAQSAFKSTAGYATEENNNKVSTIQSEVNNKSAALLSLQESISASSYATYDFNHQIKIAAKDNVAFNESEKDINIGNLNVVYEDGTHDFKWSKDIVGETNVSLKHMIKNILKNPITDDKGIKEIVDYLAKEFFDLEKDEYYQQVDGNKFSQDYASDMPLESDGKYIMNSLTDFITDKLRVALSSAMTGKSSALDYTENERKENVEDWLGTGTIQVVDKDGTKRTIPNVLKTVDGQDASTYVIADGDDDVTNGIVFGPFAIKKYDARYLGTVINKPMLKGTPGFLDPYYNKDVWNAFFSEEIEAGSLEKLTDDSDRVNDYINKITNTTWDNKTMVENISESTVAMYRILLVWFYRLLDDENNSLLPNAFFYIRNASEVLKKFDDSQTYQQKMSDIMLSKYNPGYWLSKGVQKGGELITSIFGSESTKQQVEIAKETSDENEKLTAELKQMKEDLKSGLIIAKINLICGLFTTLGALAVGEFNTPILPAVSGGNLSDYTDYIEQIKASYLDYDKLTETDLKMRRYFSYLDLDEYSNKNSWSKKIDPLKKYGTVTLNQRKYLKAAEIPQMYLMHSFYDMVMHDMRGRMARAFPTYYMLLVDEGRDLGMWHLQDNFYDVSSISEFQVVKSRKIAADTASIMMTNLFGTYTSEDEDMKDEYQYTFRDAWNSIFSPRQYYAKEYDRRQNARDFNRAKLKPGARVHLRMGYEGDASKLPILFNGAVAEVQTQDDMMNIICQGDGVELANPDMFNAADADDVEDLKYSEDMLGGLYGLFNQQTTPRDLLINPLTSSGTWIKSLIKEWSNSRFFNDNPFGIVHFGDKYFKEVFLNNGEMEQNIYESISKPTWGYSGNVAFNESLWAMETPPKIRVGLEGKRSYWDLMNIAASVSPEYIAAIAPFQLRSTIFYGAPRYYYAYDYDKTAEGKIVEKRKPYQQYHVYTSYSDIIGNKIAASDKDIRTCAVGIYQGDGWLQQTTKSVGPMWLDIDIYPENQKMTTINCNFEHRTFDLPFTIPLVGKATEFFTEDAYKIAWRATANGLKDTVKDMYTGELIVIGDPTIKPYDKMMVYDTYQDMQGTFDVEAVTQIFSVDTGFTTSVSPDCVVAVDDKYEKIAHNSMKAVMLPALVNAGTVIALSQRFANITRSMFFTAAQSVKSGTKFTENIVNSVKAVAGSEELANYSKVADKVLGKVAPAFSVTATDLGIYSSINALEKAYKALPTSHTFTSSSDLVNFLSDIKRSPDTIKALDPNRLRTQLEAALKDSSILNDANIMPNGRNTQTKIKTAIEEADKLSSIYSQTSSGSIKIDYKYIEEILAGIPDAAKEADDIKDSITYLKALEESGGIASNSKNFEEAMNNLIKVSTKIDDFSETSKLVESLSALDKSLFGTTSKSLEKFAEVAQTFKDVNTVKKGAGAIKAAMASNLLWLAAQVVLTKYVQEYLERKLKNLQVLTVFPVMKNNLVMTAGLNGNKGSVFDSPTYKEPGFIEDMAIKFFDGKYGTVLPFIMDCLVNTTDMRETVNNYKRDSAYAAGSEEVLRDTYTNKLLLGTAKQDVKGINSYREMLLVPRVANPTSSEGRVAFASNKLVDIADPSTNSTIDSNLIYIFQDEFLKKLNAPDDPSKQVLLFAAQQDVQTKDDSGNSISTYDLKLASAKYGAGKDLIVKCKKIEQGGDKLPIYDIPLLRLDAKTALDEIVKEVVKAIQPDATSDNSTLDELHKHNIIIHNATRINEKNSWFCTGYSFTIQVKDYDNFGNILESMYANMPLKTNDKGESYKDWNYKKDPSMGDNTYIVMVSPRL